MKKIINALLLFGTLIFSLIFFPLLKLFDFRREPYSSKNK